MPSYQGAIRSKNRVVFAAPCTTGTVRPEYSRRFEAAGRTRRRLYRRRVDGEGSQDGEEPRETSELSDADEGFEGVCRSCEQVDSRRCHSEREVLRSVPDRDEDREGLSPMGPRRERIRRLLSLLRAADPRPWTSARDEGDPRQPPLGGNDRGPDPGRARRRPRPGTDSGPPGRRLT